MENFAFSSMEDALDDLIGAWEEGVVDLTGIIGFLKQKGVTVAGLSSDDDVSEETDLCILESAGLLARGLIADNPDVQLEMRDAFAMGAGVLVVPVTDPLFGKLAGFCDRHVSVTELLKSQHTNPFLDAAIRHWVQK